MKRKREADIGRQLAVIGGRIAVYWGEDRIFYRGQVVAYNFGTTYTVYYDDGLREQVDLKVERFRWLLPRGQSAGYCQEVKEVFTELGAENIAVQEQQQQGKEHEEEGEGEGEGVGVTGEECVGYNVGIYWECSASRMLAEIVAFDPKTSQHHVLYRDGEGEWLDLNQENVKWYQRHRFGSFAAGVLEDGKQPPRGRGAVGWRIGIYWKQFKCFRECRVEAYDSATGKHKVVFVDGSQCEISLSNVRVIWRLPPNITDVSDISVQQRSRNELLKLSGVANSPIMDTDTEVAAVRLISPAHVACPSPLIFVYPQCNSETTGTCYSDQLLSNQFTHFTVRNVNVDLQEQEQEQSVQLFAQEQPNSQSDNCENRITGWGLAKLSNRQATRLQISHEELNSRLQLCDFWLRRIEQAQDVVGNVSRIFNAVQMVEPCSPHVCFAEQMLSTITPLKHRSLTALHLENKASDPILVNEKAQ